MNEKENLKNKIIIFEKQIPKDIYELGLDELVETIQEARSLLLDCLSLIK